MLGDTIKGTFCFITHCVWNIICNMWRRSEFLRLWKFICFGPPDVTYTDSSLYWRKLKDTIKMEKGCGCEGFSEIFRLPHIVVQDSWVHLEILKKYQSLYFQYLDPVSNSDFLVNNLRPGISLSHLCLVCINITAPMEDPYTACHL